MKNHIKYFALFCLAIIGLTSPTTTSAYDFEYNGLYYDVLSFQDMTCELTYGTGVYEGTVVIPAEAEHNKRIFKVVAIKSGITLKYIEELTIPNTINEIDLTRFSSLKKLIIQDGETVFKIEGKDYFYSSSLSNLQNIYLGRNIQIPYNSDHPFAYSNIKEITIGPQVTTINNDMFRENHKLTIVTFSKDGKLTTIKRHAFYNCDAISSIVLPNSVETIEDYAFNSNSRLRVVKLSENLKDIGYFVFANCQRLTKIVIPSSLESINYGTFSKCSIKELFIPKSLHQVKEEAFLDNPLSIVTLENADETISFDSNALPSVDSAYIGRNFTGTIMAAKIKLEPSVTALNKNNFSGSKNLTSISIPESVTTIDNSVFYGCSSLESLEIPSSVTYIGSFAFCGCTNLKKISFGNNIKDIGVKALSSCDNLSEITLFNTVPPSYLTAFTNKQYMDVTLKVPHGSLTAYQNADNWKNFWNITEMEASGISEIKTDNISILTDANSILITGAEAEDAVTIVSIDGNISYSGYDRIISGLTPGLYIVKVRDCIRKVIVK